ESKGELSEKHRNIKENKVRQLDKLIGRFNGISKRDISIVDFVNFFYENNGSDSILREGYTSKTDKLLNAIKTKLEEKVEYFHPRSSEVSAPSNFVNDIKNKRPPIKSMDDIQNAIANRIATKSRLLTNEQAFANEKIRA